MKKLFFLLIFALILAPSTFATNWIRVNQMGYLERDKKVAVMLMQQPENVTQFTITNVKSKKSTIITKVKQTSAQSPFKATARLDFSEISAPGKYVITVGNTKSHQFTISNKAYAGAQEYPLRYMRQQRCGYNPFLKDSCHLHDGIIVLDPTRTGKKVDVTGGWHDASDYLQYLTTSANATYQMLFAYQQNPNVYQDHFKANGDPGANGIPDILDEAKWGLDWMLKMNPDDNTFFNQIADDRDHRLAVLPNHDTVDYGWGAGKDRPVYPCSGKPYGLFENKNDSKGLASSLGKFASTFTLGSAIFKSIDPNYAALLKSKALNAYKVGAANPGACQTAPCSSPYYYEEDNYVDDMELAAIQLFKVTSDKKYLKDAIDYGRQEQVTPWMGADSAHHYQWYPFMNLGHYLLALQNDARVKAEFIRNMKFGLNNVRERAGNNAFMNGVPFIWCSNNLTVAIVTQAMLYRELSGDTQFQEMETAMRDWLFGVNPWGKCMIIGLPENGDYPQDPHSALSNLKKYRLDGGLVDGPVYTNIFKSLRGVDLRNPDKYAPFQGDEVVYHDDYCDYSTNEPTMDGTASMSYMLSTLSSFATK